MFAGKSCVVQALDHSTAKAESVVIDLARIRQADCWIFDQTNILCIDQVATLARIATMFEDLEAGPLPVCRTLAKLLLTAVLVALGRRSSPVWFEAALVYQCFAQLSDPAQQDLSRAQLQLFSCMAMFRTAYEKCHVLVLNDATTVLTQLQGSADSRNNVLKDLEVYGRLSHLDPYTPVDGAWPGPTSAEWQDSGLMMWLYGSVYNSYILAERLIEAASCFDEAETALHQFERLVAAEISCVDEDPGVGNDAFLAGGVLSGQVLKRLEHAMQTYSETINSHVAPKHPQGPSGSGSMLNFVDYLKERMLGSNVVLEYFVNAVCQFPSLDSTQHLPGSMRQLALAVLQLQLQLPSLIDVSQLSDTAHELYSRLEGNEQASAGDSPVRTWIEDVLGVYKRFERDCASDMEAVHTAVAEGLV